MPGDGHRNLLTGQRFKVYVGFRGRTAEITAFSNRTDSEQFSECLRVIFPDPAAVFWVSNASIRAEPCWPLIRDQLLLVSKSEQKTDPVWFNGLDRNDRSPKGRSNRILKKRYQILVGNAIRRRLSGTLYAGRIGILRYSITELMDHLSSQFLYNMSWHNWGRWRQDTKTWQIDHIKPCALFDFNDSEQLKLCWALSNLQPLWARDNILKRDRYQESPQNPPISTLGFIPDPARPTS